ncbi:hypothetical protein AMATHDRAFT_71101 [Amanita thiersii Skay4041]|uniref:Uncharacterized protein n=1 Tax=Amanita thiersii Skay4041 TaxID=703135 RepID=A0A2A9NDS0_9AGAR|nr:hypothetical protein AMATHDRAFT_71101 [Amanita thiersii Skay4041]
MSGGCSLSSVFKVQQAPLWRPPPIPPKSAPSAQITDASQQKKKGKRPTSISRSPPPPVKTKAPPPPAGNVKASPKTSYAQVAANPWMMQSNKKKINRPAVKGAKSTHLHFMGISWPDRYSGLNPVEIGKTLFNDVVLSHPALKEQFEKNLIDHTWDSSKRTRVFCFKSPPSAELADVVKSTILGWDDHTAVSMFASYSQVWFSAVPLMWGTGAKFTTNEAIEVLRDHPKWYDINILEAKFVFLKNVPKSPYVAMLMVRFADNSKGLVVMIPSYFFFIFLFFSFLFLSSPLLLILSYWILRHFGSSRYVRLVGHLRLLWKVLGLILVVIVLFSILFIFIVVYYLFSSS